MKKAALGLAFLVGSSVAFGGSLADKLRWQVELFSSPSAHPAYAATSGDQLFYTQWLGRRECPGAKLFQVSLSDSLAPVESGPGDKKSFRCVFRTWQHPEGVVLAATTAAGGQVQAYLWKEGEWQDAGAAAPPKEALQPVMEIVDSYFYDAKAKQWRSLEKRGGDWLWPGAETASLKTESTSRDRRLQFPWQSEDSLVTHEYIVDPQATSSLWIFTRADRELRRERAPVHFGQAVTGITEASGGVVVSVGREGKIYWYGVPTPELLRRWGLGRDSLRHNPWLPWTPEDSKLHAKSEEANAEKKK